MDEEDETGLIAPLEPRPTLAFPSNSLTLPPAPRPPAMFQHVSEFEDVSIFPSLLDNVSTCDGSSQTQPTSFVDSESLIVRGKAYAKSCTCPPRRPSLPESNTRAATRPLKVGNLRRQHKQLLRHRLLQLALRTTQTPLMTSACKLISSTSSSAAERSLCMMQAPLLRSCAALCP